MLKLGEKNAQKEIKYNDIVTRNEKKSLHQNMESMTK
jgi:hypothetical protein